MKLLLVHLSDIHISTGSERVLNRAKLIGSTLYESLAEADAVLIALTGDIAFSGLADQYVHAARFCKELRECIQTERDIPVYFRACSGNHDCDFTGKQNDLRETVLKGLDRKDPESLSDDVIRLCNEVQANFDSFRKELEQDTPYFEHPLLIGHRMAVSNLSVEVVSLNVAWMSSLTEKIGTLLYPTARFSDATSSIPDLRIVLMHQPPNWTNESTYRALRAFLRRISHFLLTGHEHSPLRGELVSSDSEGMAYFEGGALSTDNSSNDSSFHMALIDLSASAYISKTYVWNEKRYEPAVDRSSSWTGYRKLNIGQGALHLKEAHLAFLLDPGATLQHPGKLRLELPDFFTYPDLEISDGEDGPDYISANNLANPSRIAPSIQIKASEKAGKTALLKELCRRYVDQGIVCVFIRGESLKRSAEKELKKVIEDALLNQYSNADVESFWQTSKSSKILIVDDFDRASFPSRYTTAVIHYFQQRFKHLIVATDSLYEIETALIDSDTMIDAFMRFTIKEFGHKLRHDLIRKWLSIGDSYGAARSEKFIATFDHLERTMTAVVGKNLVPPHPIFLLILLQTSESGNAHGLQNSAFGHYYYRLIVSEFERQRINQVGELNEVLFYCSQLAWFVKSADTRHFTEEQLLQFHSVYRENCTPVEFVPRFELLIKANVLIQEGGAYRFRYQYIYFYFLGMYLNDHLADPEIQQLVRDHCKRLHVRHCANVVLFLAHHSRSQFIIESLAEALEALFPDSDPFTLRGAGSGGEMLNALVDAAPQLTFVEQASTLESRRKLREEEDLPGPISDPADDPQAGSSTSLSEEDREWEKVSKVIQDVNRLFKTVEIAGTILKSHYGQLPQTVKGAEISRLFKASRRGLTSYLQFFDQRKDILLQLVKDAILKRNREGDSARLELLAKRLMFELLSDFAYGYFFHAATSVAAEPLHSSVEVAIGQNVSEEDEILKLLVHMDTSEGFKPTQVSSLYKKFETNLLARRLVQKGVLHHLYMFKADHADKQSLCKAAEIDIQDQAATDFLYGEAKRIA